MALRLSEPAVANRIVGAATTIAGVVVLVSAVRLPFWFAGSLGPALIPTLVGSAWILCGVYLAVRPVVAGDSIGPFPNRRAAARAGALVTVFLVHAWLIDVIGFYGAAIVLCILSLRVMSNYAWWRVVLGGAAMGGAIAFIAVDLLAIPLPS
jgi:hypothetical protein